MNRRKRLPSTVAVIPVVLCLAGCASSTKVVIETQPRWSFEQYDSVTVMPFASRVPEVPDAGAALGAALERALVANRTKTLSVVPWASVLDRLSIEEVAGLPGRVERREPLPEALQSITQALVTGVCTQYETIGDVQRQWVPRPSYVTNAEGESVLMGEHLVERDRYVHAATVAAELTIVDTVTGQVLHRHAGEPVTVRREGWREPPAESPDALAARAVEIVARRLMAEVVHTRAEATVRSKSLLTASRFRDGRWDKERDFSAGGSRLFVVVRDLPPALDGSLLRLEIGKKGERAPIISESFDWTGAVGRVGRRFAYAPATLAEKGGVGRYRVTLWVGDEPIAERDFRLRTPDEDDDD